MKKQFLLLVMALMSITSWAAPTVGTKPVGATGLTYNGSAQGLVATEGTATPDGEGTVSFYYKVTTTATAPAFDVTKWSAGKASVKETNAGTYYVWYVAYQSATSYTDPAQVVDGEGNVTTVEIARKHLTTAGTPLTTPSDGVYTGKDQTETYNTALSVTDKALGKTIDPGQFTITYVKYSAADEDFVDVDKVQKAGSYKQKIVAKATGNYDGEMISKTFKIAKAELVVKVKDLSTYFTGMAKTGDDFEITYEGFVNGETAAAVFTAPYDAPAVDNDKVDAGTYDVIATGDDPENYTLVPVKGKLTIAAAKVQVAVNRVEEALGSEAASVTSWTGSDYFSLDEPEHVLATKYITVKVQNGVNAKGEATYGAAQAIANFATYLETAKYEVENENPELDPYVYNYVKGITLTRTAGTAAGEYPLTATGATAKKNYEIVYAEGKFVIGKAKAVITLDNMSKTYGEEDPEEYSYTITGLDETDLATLTEKITVTRAEGEEVGSYKMTLTVADKESFSNFTIDETNSTFEAKFMITKRTLKITALPQVLYTGMNIDDLDQTSVTFATLAEGEEVEVELSFSDAVKTTYMTALEDLKLGVGVKSAEVDGGIEVTVVDNKANEAILKNYKEPTLAAGKLTIIAGADVLYLDDTKADLAASIEEADGEERLIKFSSRTLKAGQWNTLVLPFATTVAEISKLLKKDAADGYAVVDVLGESSSPEKISLKIAFGEIEANTPFLVQPAEDVDLSTINFGTKEIEYSETPEVNDGQGHYFKGTYVGHNVTSADKSEYYYSSTKKSFVNSSKSTKIGIMRAYLKDTNAAGAGARIITIEEPDGSVTAIDAIEAGNGETNGAIYNLQGVRVNKAGKGVYIQNGKKFIK